MTDGGIVSEACYPYTAKDGVCNRNAIANCKDRVLVKDHGYVGGYYGATTESGMLQEIFQWGPVAISFEVTPAFAAYSSGIFNDCSESSAYARHSVNYFVLTNHVYVSRAIARDCCAQQRWRRLRWRD